MVRVSVSKSPSIEASLWRARLPPSEQELADKKLCDQKLADRKLADKKLTDRKPSYKQRHNVAAEANEKLAGLSERQRRRDGLSGAM